MVGEGEIGAPLADAGQALLRFRLQDRQLHLRVVGDEPGEGGGQQPSAAAGEGGDGERDPLGGQPVDAPLGVGEFGGDRVGRLHQQAARVRQRDAPGGTFDRGRAETTLQGGDLLRDGRGGAVQCEGRPVEAAVTGDLAQNGQPLNVDQQFS
ncbi:hypothetical protein GA0115255_116702 [Streptomyces sp. Ncost-T6T-2b]|nr:hypothetical protein GA0115255_116702 [Streptomyces sp. Ncost-T6T-2b]